MSCKHGNWSDCEECQEEYDNDTARYERGFAAGVEAAKRIIQGQFDPPKRWRIEIGSHVIRGVDLFHFCEQNGYKTEDRCKIGDMEIGHTIRVYNRTITCTGA